MKINGLIEKPRWYDIPCICGKNTVNKFPIKDCLNCKFQLQEDSMPKENFICKDVKGKDRKISEITIVRGSKFQDIIGWTF